MSKSDVVCCPYCERKNIEPLENDTWECYDCGVTFTLSDVVQGEQEFYRPEKGRVMPWQ